MALEKAKKNTNDTVNLTEKRETLGNSLGLQLNSREKVMPILTNLAKILRGGQ